MSKCKKCTEKDIQIRGLRFVLKTVLDSLGAVIPPLEKLINNTLKEPKQ